MSTPEIPTANDLGKVIKSPQARFGIYAAYVIAVLFLGAFQVGFAAAQVDQPTWLIVAMQVAAYLGAPVGFLAAANSTKEKNELF